MCFTQTTISNNSLTKKSENAGNNFRNNDATIETSEHKGKCTPIMLWVIRPGNSLNSMQIREETPAQTMPFQHTYAGKAKYIKVNMYFATP